MRRDWASRKVHQGSLSKKENGGGFGFYARKNSVRPAHMSGLWTKSPRAKSCSCSTTPLEITSTFGGTGDAVPRAPLACFRFSIAALVWAVSETGKPRLSSNHRG